MAGQDSDFLKRLLATFGIEAQEHLDALYAGIAELEKNPDAARQAELVETIFREAHSLKGAARSVNLTQVEAACQSLESTFAAMKNKQVALTAKLIDELHQEIHRLGGLLAPPQSVPEPAESRPAAPEARLETSMPRQDVPPREMAAKAPARPPEERAPMAGTVRIATEKLDSIFLQTEEMLAAKLQAQQRKQELQTVAATVAVWGKEWANFRVRHPDFYATAAAQPQWLELLEQNTAFIKSLTYQLGAVRKSAEQDQRMLGRMVDELLDDMKKILMLPFSTLMELFPKLVRELARDYGKEIDLDIQGAELEADRRILETMKDPLIHLVRNSIDHGIEKPEERARRNKPPRGRITISILPRSGNRVEIRVADDGKGIDTAGVRASAERLGLLAREEAAELEEHAAVELIYQSGLSTSPIITEVSGRGLGLAIVREKVDKLGGSVSVETRPAAGTCFSIVLPLTLATYRGVTVRVGEQLFVLPTSHVEQTARVDRESVQTVENRETVSIDEEMLSLAWLGDVLGIAARGGGETMLQVAVLAARGKRIAFVVDEVLGEQEVLVKGLGRQLSRVRNIAAATILGSGKVVPILNVADLLKSALQPPGGKFREAAASGAEEAPGEKNVLVVEDSITARSLLKGILEVAGYQVATAIDGIDGLTQLRSGEFDIVVSDVDMPRMNGFDLTAKIRSDKKLAELPVVLVTALESREDRERGIDVGANAYIVKRSFEQSNLLEVVRRLI